METTEPSTVLMLGHEGQSNPPMELEEIKEEYIAPDNEEQEPELPSLETSRSISERTFQQLREFFNYYKTDDCKIPKKSPPRVCKSVAAKVYKFEKLNRRNEPEPEEGYDEVDAEYDEVVVFERSKFTSSLRNPKTHKTSSFFRRLSGRFGLYSARKVKTDEEEYECTKL